MFLYADAQACPGCRARLTPPAPTCPACGLSLAGPDGARVFALLGQVDQVVGGMYAQRSPVGVPATPAAPAAPAAVSQPHSPGAEGGSPTAGAPVQGDPKPGVLSSASVPKILLGLGALCLLAAALVFLAVAWALMGVGARTVALAIFTAVAAVLTVAVAQRDLRAGTEALSSVSLGLFALVLNGVWRTGWVGSLDGGLYTLIAGVFVAGASIATLHWVTTTPVRSIIAPDVTAALGVAAAALGAAVAFNSSMESSALAALAVGVVGAAVGHRLAQPILALGSASVAAVGWLVLLMAGAARLETPLTLHLLWVEFAAWPLLLAAALVAMVAAVRSLPVEGRVIAAATAVLLVTLVVVAPVFDESPTRLALVELAVVAAYAAIATRLPGLWKWVCAAPSVVASVGLAISVVRLGVTAVIDLVVNEPWSRGFLERVDAPDVPLTWPLLLPAGVVGISVTVATLMHCSGRLARWVIVPGTAATIAAVSLLPTLYAAPLAIALGGVLLGAGVIGAAAARLRRDVLAAAAAALTALALLGALANDWTTAAVLGAITVAAVAVEVRGRNTAVGALVGTLSGGALVWTLGHLAGLEIVWQALAVIVVLGVAIIVRPRIEREVAAGLAVAVVIGLSAISVGASQEHWLAIHLTVAGVACTVSALLHRDRRVMAWVGLALLTAAQWVRLQQLGVGTVEAYTLPLALVLIVVGTIAMLRSDKSSFATLTPGLSLALVPSLLLVLVDPVSLRALLLGAACVLLLLIGMARGWAAPLVAGASVLALMVLRQVTHIQVIPQWILIGLVGIVLTIIGITWEQRLQEIRKVSAYVRSLR